MSVSISNMTMPQLIGVLKDLKGGAIGFDVFRNPETKTKAALLQYILKNFTNDAIIPAVQRVASGEAKEESPTHPPLVSMPKMPVRPLPTEQAPNPDDAAALAAILSRMTGGATVNESQVKAIVDAAFDAKEAELDAKIASVTAPTRVVLEQKGPDKTESKDLGVQHFQFPNLLKACNARDKDGHRLNIWLAGPVGTGKTTAAHKVADAMGLQFQANSSLLTKFDVEGYIDAGGKYHRTALREVFEHGGVYLGDEFDGWAPAATLSMNAILANGWARFPDGMIKRHPDCIIILAGNTFGKGATAEFTARNKQDNSTLDRMVYLRWPVDEKLEMHFSPNHAWTAKVQKFRQKAKDRKLKDHDITPRASVKGAALLEQGLPEELVMEMTLRMSLNDDQWGALCR